MAAALTRKSAGACEYMIASSDELLSLLHSVATQNAWTLMNTDEMIVHLRYDLNEELIGFDVLWMTIVPFGPECRHRGFSCVDLYHNSTGVLGVEFHLSFLHLYRLMVLLRYR